MSRPFQQPIAIVGLGGIFPGATDLDAFWTMLENGDQAIGEPPPGRWVMSPKQARHTDGIAPDRVRSTRGGYLQDFRCDPQGLQLSPDFIATLDPLYHLALHAGRQALHSSRWHAGSAARTAVILGNIALPTAGASRLAAQTLGRTFAEQLLEAPSPDQPDSPNWIDRYAAGLPAGVVAKALGLGGGCYTLDAACAASLYAIKLACDELTAGRADTVLSGGLARPDSLYTQMGFSQLQAVSPSGRCAPFDRHRDGLVVGEGAGMFVLKRLADAQRDGEQIHGVIRAVGLSNDIQGDLLAPSNEGQLRAMRAAYQQAGWQPQDVQLIECHATSTPLGDAVEYQSLRTLWGENRHWQPGQCVLGSVKSNIGHLLTGAGAAGLMKVLLAIRHRKLPPTVNFTEPGADLDTTDSPFRIINSAEAWESQGPRRAAVSGFGFGGINAHLLVEEWQEQPPRPQQPTVVTNTAEPIAVVGMAAHFGPWNNLEAVAAALGGENISPPRPPHWWGSTQTHWFRQLGIPEETLAGHFLNPLEVPIGRFRIPPNELPEILPQQLLMLMTADDALQDPGWQPGNHTDAGVFIGLGLDLNTTNFHLRWDVETKAPAWAKLLGAELDSTELDSTGLQAWTKALKDAISPPLTANRTLGALGGIVASRIARQFHIGGPAFTVQSEDGSALRAIEVAARLLQRGEINTAIAGAVDLHSDLRSLLADRLLHPTRVERHGEGAAAVVLKRLADAEAAGDRIYAVIRGIGCSCGGAVDEPHCTPESQAEALRRAREDAGLDGEVTALADAAAELGFSGAAAGLASFVKGALTLNRRETKRLSIHSTGMDGSCSAIILESHSGTTPRPITVSRPPTTTTVTLPIGGTGFAPPRPDCRRPLPSTAAFTGLERAGKAVAKAHRAFLQFSQSLQQALATAAQPIESTSAEAEVEVKTKPECWLDRAQCLALATGNIGAVLGERFAFADRQPTRVRLPDEPLMLVDRMLHIEGEPLSLSGGRLITEHDIHADAWYLDGGRIPTCIAVEAGQADLFLCAYLGIDAVTQGLAVYRLLDAVITFHDSLPGPGATIRYDIRILRFFRQGETHLFKFEFDATVNGAPLLSMREGCAGFFTPEQLASGEGIIPPARHLQCNSSKDGGFRTLAPTAVEQYNEGQLNALRQGDLSACFGRAFAALPLRQPMPLPGARGRLKLIDRITHLDPNGGQFGLGIVRAEAPIHPDDWFLTCHFSDDPVMPGTLMYECCMHSLRVLLMRLGWVGEQDSFYYEPVPGVTSRLKCRGQVIPTTKLAAYEVNLKEIGYDDNGTPYAIATALMYADGRAVVAIDDMSVRCNGLTKAFVETLWQHGNRDSAGETEQRPAIFDDRSITAFAEGNPSEAFGERYRIFDQQRRIARLPRAPYKFLDRIVRVEAAPWELKAGGEIDAQYQIPEDAWYFAAEHSDAMPFAVLLEVALQPCGWLAAYLGSALTSQQDLSFRNLGGEAVQYLPVTRHSGVLTTTVKITDVHRSGDMLIQHYDFTLRNRGETVYQGTTYFGFFPQQALANQVGIRDATLYQPSAAEIARGQSAAYPIPYPSGAPFPEQRLRMVDRIELWVPDGGPAGLGFIRGAIDVDPDAWFFQAHFYQDPVWPGSLGLESFLQLLKYAAIELFGGAAEDYFEAVALEQQHQWVYRGQILPTDHRVKVQAEITAVDSDSGLLCAEGFLSVDDRVIYAIHHFALRWRPAR